MQSILLTLLACITAFIDIVISIYTVKKFLQSSTADQGRLLPALLCFIMNTIVAAALIIKLW